MDKKVKNFLEKGFFICLGITVLMVLVLSIQHEDRYATSNWNRYYTGWWRMFWFGKYINYFLAFIIGSVGLLGVIVLGIMYFVLRKCELQITENNVKGKTLLGKEVVLPLYMVSAYSTRKFLSTISVATASGITKFALIGNYQEIGEVLSKKINERQQNTETTQKTVAVPTATPASSADELKKFKELLDAGIITQEEFDAKKKQLLGL